MQANQYERGSLLYTGSPNTPNTPDTLVGKDDFDFKRKGWKLSSYPLTLLFIILWAGYIGGTIWLLEQAVARAPKATTQPWWISDLPTVLLTIFAQGHGAITAMHLARLGISALQHPRTAPNSWAELFWLADRNWQGPFGLGATLFGQAKLGSTTLSTTFVLFAVTCLFALPTPIALSKTYQVRTVQVRSKGTVQTNALVPEVISTVGSSAQMSSGAGAWGTGMPVTQIYNSTTFTPAGHPRNVTPSDIVFAGQLLDVEANMAAIHMAGGCRVFEPDANDLPIDSTTPGTQSFWSWCSRRMPAVQEWDDSYLSNAWNVNLTIHWCSTFDRTDNYWTLNSTAANVSALVWIDMTDSITESSGFIQCDTKFEIGTAALAGSNDSTFSSFDSTPLYNATMIQSGMPFIHPLSAALEELTLQWNKSEISIERGITVLTMYGFTPSWDPYSRQISYKMPSLDTIANELWGGAMHMGAAIGALSRRGGQVVPVIEHSAMSGRVRDKYFALATVALLGGWAGMLLLCTFRMFRATFAPSLDSYTAARLLVDVPFLVDEHCCGELELNGNLRAGFKRVGDGEPGAPTGHIASGGAGMLVRNREYSGRVKAEA